MTQAPPNRADIHVDYEAVCQNCGFKKKIIEASSSGYKVGSIVVRDTEDPFKNRCNRCKAYGTLEIMKVPGEPEPTKPRGFWKIPEE